MPKNRSRQRSARQYTQISANKRRITRGDRDALIERMQERLDQRPTFQLLAELQLGQQHALADRPSRTA